MTALTAPAEPRSAVADDALLRLVLKLDAGVTAANGAAYLLAAGLLDGPLGLDAAALRGTGAFLLGFAAIVWAVAARPWAVRPAAAAAVVVVNAVWVVDSLALVALDWASPTTAGAVWVVLQACVVGLFAGLQLYGVRRVSRASSSSPRS